MAAAAGGARSVGLTTADKAGLPARLLAVHLVDGAIRMHRAVDENLDHLLRQKPFDLLDRRDRAFAQALALTSLRHKGDIDTELLKFLEKPLPRSAALVNAILLTGAAQIFFMRVPIHAAIDSAVSLAKHDKNARHFSGLVNAVLRKLNNLPVPVASPERNTPDWLWKRWTEAYGHKTALEVAEAHQNEPALDLSVQQNEQNWAKILNGVVLPTGSIRLKDYAGSVEDLPGYSEGDWWIQDAAAAMPARLLGDVRDKDVLDVCAAPGGKSAQLAAAGARVTAIDISEKRMVRFIENMNRLKLHAEVKVCDFLRFQSETRFDAILLDAPCSATGTIRRHPDLPYVKTPNAILDLSRIQRRMLEHAVGFLKPNGCLIYCTCSLEREEGEDQISAFLEWEKSVVRKPIQPAEVAGLSHLLTAQGDLRTLPSMNIDGEHGLDGFFASRLARKAAD